MSTIKDLAKRQLCNPPSFLPESIQYEVIMGSFAYGVSSDTSDVDLYGFCIPDKRIIFPHLDGEIPGFGQPRKNFEVWQEHHIKDGSALSGKGREYDVAMYSIVKYFQLCMENNPNMIDSLFVPQNCIVYTTLIGELVRENRRVFLHKGAWPKFKGYAYSQMHKMRIKKHEGGRGELVDKFGYDIKYAYHVVRLINEVEQLLTEGDIDLLRNREQLKSIRRGDWTLDEIENYFDEKEMILEKAYHDSKLPALPNEKAIKQLLVNCLEQHFGNLKGCYEEPDPALNAIRQIEEICRSLRASEI